MPMGTKKCKKVQKNEQVPATKQLPKGCSQTTLTDFWTFLTPPLLPWLTALLNKMCNFYLVTLTFGELSLPLAVNVVYEKPLIGN